MTTPAPDLAFLARQIEIVIGEFRTMRGDMTVMMEILRRTDHRVGALELRVGALETAVYSVGAQLTDMHAYNRRVEERVRKLEDAPA